MQQQIVVKRSNNLECEKPTLLTGDHVESIVSCCVNVIKELLIHAMDTYVQIRLSETEIHGGRCQDECKRKRD